MIPGYKANPRPTQQSPKLKIFGGLTFGPLLPMCYLKVLTEVITSDNPLISLVKLRGIEPLTS